VLVILFTVLVSTGVEYRHNVKRISTHTLQAKARDLADILSRVYSEEQGWDSLEPVLIRTGFLIDPGKAKARQENVDILEWLAFGVVVMDTEGQIVLDSLADLTRGADIVVAKSEPYSINDLSTGQTVGIVTLYVNRAYLSAETRRFLQMSITPTAIEAGLTAILALLLALWLSRRIAAPITALTRATQAIADGSDAQTLPVNSSDELGQMSASFNQMITSLETQRDLRKRLIDDVSHELYTPLSVIRLEAKGLHDDLRSPVDAADRIMDEVDTLGSLVRDLDWLAETDASAPRLEMASHSLGPLLTAEVERWQLPAQVAGVDLELFPLPLDLPTVQMDAMRIGQALGNLIQNGLQHTPSGGRVSIRCETTDEWVELCVCDTGTGIAAEHLPLIFERLYRAEASRQRDTGGRGLGLAIVKRIVEAHQGQVSVESTPSVGSCFRLWLPIERE